MTGSQSYMKCLCISLFLNYDVLPYLSDVLPLEPIRESRLLVGQTSSWQASERRRRTGPRCVQGGLSCPGDVPFRCGSVQAGSTLCSWAPTHGARGVTTVRPSRSHDVLGLGGGAGVIILPILQVRTQVWREERHARGLRARASGTPCSPAPHPNSVMGPKVGAEERVVGAGDGHLASLPALGPGPTVSPSRPCLSSLLPGLHPQTHQASPRSQRPALPLQRASPEPRPGAQPGSAGSSRRAVEKPAPPRASDFLS